MSDTSLRLLVDSGDGGESTPEMLSSLEALLASDGEAFVVKAERFESIEDLLAREEEDLSGRFFEWPNVPGWEVWITGNLAVTNEYQRLEKAYRRKNKIGEKDDLPFGAADMLTADALIAGRGVKEWRGAKHKDGSEWPYSEKDFQRIYRGSKRFREFVSEHYNRLSGIAKRLREQARGE